jgi:hypothetical protein
MFDFRGTSEGSWDFDHEGTNNDALALTFTPAWADKTQYTDVLDVTNCSASGTQSCLSEGSATVIRYDILGRSPSFSGSSLIYENGGSLIELDLDSLSSRTIGSGYRPNTAE